MDNRLSVWVEKLKGARILVAGEMGIDEYLSGECCRISPEAPVPIVEVDSHIFRLGLSANVAQNIASLGASVELVSVRGADADGDRMVQMLSDHAIVSHLITDSTRPTLRKVRVTAQKQHLIRIDFEKSHLLDSQKSREFCAAVVEKLPDFDAVVLQDYAKGIWHAGTVSIISEARRLGKAVYVDPNRYSPLLLYRGALVVTPNLIEALVLCGASPVPSKELGPDDEKLRQLAAHIIEKTGIQFVIITCGEWGMVGLERETGRFTRIPTYAREVFDVTGAGDTVISVFALMHTMGASIDQCMRVSNAAAGIVVGRLGASCVTPLELENELNRLEPDGSR